MARQSSSFFIKVLLINVIGETDLKSVMINTRLLTVRVLRMSPPWDALKTKPQPFVAAKNALEWAFFAFFAPKPAVSHRTLNGKDFFTKKHLGEQKFEDGTFFGSNS